MNVFNKTTLILLLTLIGSSAFAQKNKCLSQVKTGVFTYEVQGVTITVERTKTKQIESYNDGKSKLINKLEWISDNQFEITFVKAVNSPGCLEKGDKMMMTIMECGDNWHKVVGESENCGSAEVVLYRK